MVNVILNFILIPYGRASAAAFTSGISALVICVWLLVKKDKRVKLNYLWEVCKAPLVGSLLIMVFCLIMKHFISSVLILTLVCMLVSVFIYGLTQYAMKNDLVTEAFNSIIRKIRQCWRIKMNSIVKIMICCHKKTDVCTDDIYLPIQVGHAMSTYDMDMQKDDRLNENECENISKYNNIYCEMTAMFWAWKNIRKIYKDIEYVGLCHYRRYFFVENNRVKEYVKYYLKKVKNIVRVIINKANGFTIYDPQYNISSLNEQKLIDSNKRILQEISGFDIIATHPCKIINSTVGDFFNVIGRVYMDLMTEIIDSEFPTYKNSYHQVISGSKLYAGNMIILKTELLDEYCFFVFGVLDKHISYTKERGICINPETEGTYSRVSGYLAEILTCTYINYHKDACKFKELGKCFIRDL